MSLPKNNILFLLFLLFGIMILFALYGKPMVEGMETAMPDSTEQRTTVYNKKQ